MSYMQDFLPIYFANKRSDTLVDTLIKITIKNPLKSRVFSYTCGPWGRRFKSCCPDFSFKIKGFQECVEQLFWYLLIPFDTLAIRYHFFVQMSYNCSFIFYIFNIKGVVFFIYLFCVTKQWSSYNRWYSFTPITVVAIVGGYTL